MATSRYKHTAFVLGLFDTGLAVVRSLGRIGIPVIGLDSDPTMPGFKSRYCIAKLSPDPLAQPDNLLEFLLTEGKRLDFPGILFPTTDAFVVFVSRYQEILKSYFRFILPSPNIIESFLDKHQQYELAKKAGMVCPALYYPRTVAELNDIKEKLSYPVFIKPCHTYLWKNRLPNKGYTINSSQELVEKFKMIWSMGLQGMVQSIIPGPFSNNFEISVYVSTKGKILAIFSVRKLRQFPPDLGTGTLVESIHYQELVDIALRLLNNLGYRGIANIEFKWDESDRQLKFIELNARLWQQNDQADVCGLNFPLIVYSDLIGEEPPPLLKHPAGVKWLDLIADFQSFWHHFRQKELSLGAWLYSWRGTKSFSVFKWDDPLPALHSIEYGLKLLRLPLYLFQNQ